MGVLVETDLVRCLAGSTPLSVTLRELCQPYPGDAEADQDRGGVGVVAGVHGRPSAMFAPTRASAATRRTVAGRLPHDGGTARNVDPAVLQPLCLGVRLDASPEAPQPATHLPGRRDQPLGDPAMPEGGGLTAQARAVPRSI